MDGISSRSYRAFSKAGAWDGDREQEFARLYSEGLCPGRVMAANRNLFRIKTGQGDVEGTVAGKLLLETNKEAFPTVGDWTAVDVIGAQAVIRHVLSRRSCFSRQTAGRKIEEQVVAANLDYVLIALGLDGDYNLKRLDRYLVQACHGCAQPVVVLTKADLCADVCAYLARTQSELNPNVRVHAISSVTGYGLSEMDPYLQPGTTSLLIGSSGVGKSTFINRILGNNAARTGVVSPGNGRGRCTTTGTQAFETGAGACLIDCAGMREMQLWTNAAHFGRAFEDIQALAARCRFRDCAHKGEPGCAVAAALSEGELTQERFLNYVKLREELGQTKKARLRAKEDRFRKVAILARQQRRMRLK